MSKTKRRHPYDPSKAHDRRATESNRGVNKHLAPMEVDDPYEPGAKITVMRNKRNDPLGSLHAHKSIDEAQYRAGRAFQDDHEAIEHGAKAADPSQPYVDCSIVAMGVSDSFSKALVRLNRAHAALGLDLSPLAHDVLVRGWTYGQVAAARGFAGERWEKFFGMSFAVCLHRLSYIYGFAVEPTGKQRFTDTGTR